MSQRQEILDNPLAQIPNTPKQQGTPETMDDVLSSAGAQHVDNSGSKVWD